MGKLDAIAAILGLGIVGGALFMFATKRWKLPNIGDIFSGIFPKVTPVGEQVTKIQLITGEVQDITKIIEQMQGEFHQQALQIQEDLGRVQILAERSVAREELYATAYQQALERETTASISRIPEESALRTLARKQPHVYEWLRRNMPYAVPY